MYTAIAAMTLLVSLDALFVGVSLRLHRQFKPAYIFVVFGIVLAMCTAACAAADALTGRMHFDTSWLAGGAFLLLGLKTLLAKDEENTVLAIGTVAALGFFVSIDGAVLAAALTIEHGRSFLTPVIIAAGHLLCLAAGSLLSNCIKVSCRRQNILSASCLFLVAALNITGVL